MELITIAESHVTTDLLVLKSKLEAEGIYCIIKDEYTTDVLSHLPNMMSKLQIYSTEIPAVRELMKKNGYDYSDLKTVCPKCSSKNIEISKEATSRMKYIMRYIKSQFLMQDSYDVVRDFHCNHCQADFVA